MPFIIITAYFLVIYAFIRLYLCNCMLNAGIGGFRAIEFYKIVIDFQRLIKSLTLGF